MVEGLINPEMVPETIDIIKDGIKNGVCMNVILNNRCGGNAPLIAKELVGKLGSVLPDV